ncbi:MAG: DUF5681 domain-containing protein [Pseudomonadota bacterium]
MTNDMINTQSETEETETIGYGNPPKAGQFKKGQSGNPAGRPKGSKNMRTLFESLEAKQIPIKNEAGDDQVGVIEAIILKLGENALKGDHKAIAKILELKGQFDQAEQKLTPEKIEELIGAIRAFVFEMSRDAFLSGATKTEADKQAFEKVNAAFKKNLPKLQKLAIEYSESVTGGKYTRE